MLDDWLAKNLLPDWLVVQGIRRLNRRRLRDLARAPDGRRFSEEEIQDRFTAFCEELRKAPIALYTEEANEQHYELPPEFFQIVMGEHMKYSCCYWDDSTPDLSAAELRSLDLTIERADLQDGQSILELGCGWGSLTVRMAERFPKSKITAVSNSAPQKKFIQGRLKAKKLKNVEIITADMNDFKTPKKFQRIVSVEMFEHMRNYEKLFAKVRGFMAANAKLFIHVFNHRSHPYIFEVTDDETDWMGRYFFSGGMMPSKDLYLYFAPPLRPERIWTVDGWHYYKTSYAWLENMDRNKDEVMRIMAETYGADDALRWFSYWRIFFIAVAELFGMYDGRQWEVTHYLFTNAKPPAVKK